MAPFCGTLVFNSDLKYSIKIAKYFKETSDPGGLSKIDPEFEKMRIFEDI